MILISSLVEKTIYRSFMRRNRRFSKWPLMGGLLLALGGGPWPSAMADEITINPSIVGQVRENVSGETEIPVNGYFGFSGSFKPLQIGFEENLRIFREFTNSLDDFDLYQAVVHVQPLEALRIDFGRQFVNQGFAAQIVDGLQMTITPPGSIGAAVYAGIPRTVERGDFNKDDGMTAGFSVGLQGIARTHANIHAAWRRFDLDLSDWRENDVVLAGGDFSYQFAGKSHPFVYTVGEYNVSGQTFETGTAGLDISPMDRLALNFEFNYFDIDRQTLMPTAFSLFTRGSTFGGRFGATAALIPDFLDFVVGYSYQWIEIQEGIRRSGHLVEGALQFYDADVGIHVAPGLYYDNSFGGNLTGVRLSLHEQFIKRIYASFGVDYGLYHKITGNDDSALSLYCWNGYEVVDGLTVSAGAEYNHNNLYKTDVRGSFKVDYRFDHKK